MLILRTNEGHTDVRACGSIVEICSDLCICVRALYNSLDEDSQDLFKSFVRDMPPVLPFQDDTELKKEEEKTDEEIRKVLCDDIVKKLNKILEALK